LGVKRETVTWWTSQAWWRPEFRDRSGFYDVDAIREAQAARPTQQARNLSKARAVVQMRTEQLQMEIKATELAKRKRQEEEALGNLLPADVYEEFTRELLGMVLRGLDEIPVKMAKQVPPDVVPLVYVPKHKQKRERDAAPLQKLLRRLENDIRGWLEQDPEEETAQ
jgi:hypothetical protein